MRFMPAFVAKGPVKKWPVFGPLSIALNCIFVDRFKVWKTGDKAPTTTELIKEKLNKQLLGLCMFPEVRKREVGGKYSVFFCFDGVCSFVWFGF